MTWDKEDRKIILGIVIVITLLNYLQKGKKMIHLVKFKSNGIEHQEFTSGFDFSFNVLSLFTQKGLKLYETDLIQVVSFHKA